MRGEIETALGIEFIADAVENNRLPSCFAVSQLLSASVGCGKRDELADRGPRACTISTLGSS
jgi:hypothetical protein